jgi:hypothetical protein
MDFGLKTPPENGLFYVRFHPCTTRYGPIGSDFAARGGGGPDSRAMQIGFVVTLPSSGHECDLAPKLRMEAVQEECSQGLQLLEGPEPGGVVFPFVGG